MRILITSGGTKIPIDPVRSITNHSTGRFGASIAKAALLANMDVLYLSSQEGASPFSKFVDASNSLEENILALKNLHAFNKKYSDHYVEYRYKNFSEYAALLEKIIIQYQPDAVILAAAVSDYTIENYSHNKIRSHDQLHLQLISAPKLIHQIKQWAPDTKLIGFKLLIDGSDKELVNASLESISKNKADLIVANNLTSLQQGAHEIILVEPNGHYEKIKNNLAEAIIERIK